MYLRPRVMATSWVLLCGAVIVVRMYEVSQWAALGWVTSFAASSLATAYCLGRLL